MLVCVGFFLLFACVCRYYYHKHPSSIKVSCWLLQNNLGTFSVSCWAVSSSAYRLLASSARLCQHKQLGSVTISSSVLSPSAARFCYHKQLNFFRPSPFFNFSWGLNPIRIGRHSPLFLWKKGNWILSTVMINAYTKRSARQFGAPLPYISFP